MMNTMGRSVGVAVAAAVLAAIVSGCDRPPATNGQDVLDYVRNAAAGAKVRRLDDPAQAYVDAIFKPYQAWKKANAPVDEIADVDALWEKDSNDWRDGQKVASRISAVFTWSADAAQPKSAKGLENADEADEADAKKDGNDEPKTRTEHYEALLAAVANVPELPVALEADLVSGIPQRLSPEWGGLEKASQRYQRVTGAYRDLLAYVCANAAQFDPTGSGLEFTTPGATDEAVKLWSTLHAILEAERVTELQRIESLLTDGRQRRDEAIKEKQGMRKSGVSNESEARRLRELDLLVLHYDARIKAAEKRKKGLDDIAKKKSIEPRP